MAEDSDSQRLSEPIQEPVIGGDPEDVARAKKVVGTTIADRYRIHNLLAMGGMGAVYTAEHVHMRKRVALKLLHPDTEGLPGLVSRFEREAIVGAHVEHTNVAAARDFGKLPDGSYYLVLEFVRGATLRQLINQGPMSPTRAARIAKQIAAGLGAVHKRGIVHRDVAPRNVMVVAGTKEKVKLIDFGFAKVPVENFMAVSTQQGVPMAPSEITQPGIIFGTIGYLAPEAAAGMPSVDARSDLYALGAMLYEMLAGEPPFGAPTQAMLFQMHRTEEVPPIAERAPGVVVPPALEAIARKLLAKRPKDRFASASEVVRALDDVLVSHAPESRVSERGLESDAVPTFVVGEQAPVSLPRFEDVADTTPEPAVREVGSSKSVIGEGPPATQRVSEAPARRSRLGLALLFVLIGAVGAGAYVALRGREKAKETPVAASTPSIVTTSAASVSDTSMPPKASSAPAMSAPLEVGGKQAEAWKRIVRQAQSTLDWGSGADGLLALAELDREALSTPEMKAAALEVTVNGGQDKERAGKLVDALATKLGSGGIDVLYDIATLRGGSRAASLAALVLAKPEVRARGTKAFLVAIELREAKCNDKLALLERARADGDLRALATLTSVRSADCASAGCCLWDKPEIERTIQEVSERNRKR